MCEALIKSIEINKKEKGFTVLDVPSSQFINALADYFKEKNIIKVPKYAPLVKTSKSNDCEPISQDYIYYRAAAICRKLYLTKSKNLGVGSLRSMFSKKQRRGSQPPRTFRAGGKIIRELVIQLKGKEYIDNYGQNEEETDKGLHLTKKGRSELDKIAAGLMKK
ncbi:MAG: 40S ribosomal protein S19 [Methanobrevibacter sp.]|jgi:small subunit ribosomal protein S19e|nr:40S ribosomal protein S19 [Methanobrevibacter sp.]